MAVDFDEILGPGKMSLWHKEEVIALLRAMPTDPQQKRFLYARWARVVGFEPAPEDIDAVAAWNEPWTPLV